MSIRPSLDKKLDADIFCNFYWLKEELVEFCRANNLPTSGGKAEITERIALYLKTGSVALPKQKHTRRTVIDVLTEETEIEPNFVCSEKHRAFFRKKIGQGFSFNVLFQKWLKANAGKTYKQAIAAYYELLEEKKSGNKVIGKQFEYNAYIRAFFEENKGMSLQQAIQCWNYKKSLEGDNAYEKNDLVALEDKGKL